MNARLYAAAVALCQAELRADPGAFFGSIFSRLAHIYTADRHWLKRFAAAMPDLAALDAVRAAPLPRLVRGIVSPDFAKLRMECDALDAVFVTFTREATFALYAQPLDYTNTTSETHCKWARPVLRHVFNHQTRHRGQITTLLSQRGIDVGVTDLSALILECAAG